jgi:hypothetical protein
MLFDLRSRGRRRTVQVVYIGLAVLIGSGLILFGVGTGGSGGGLFGAFTGSGTSHSSNAAITTQTKQAIAATKKSPNSPAAWSSLVDARLSAANSVGYDTTTSTYTTAGQQQLSLLTTAYQRYLKLVKTPSADTVTIAAHAFSQLDRYATAADTYEELLQVQPGNIKGLECTSLLSYAAGNDRVGQLAENKVLSKLPKTARAETKTELEEAKTDKATATETC